MRGGSGGSSNDVSGCSISAFPSEELDSASREDALKSHRGTKVGARYFAGVDLLRRGPVVWLESRPPTLCSSMGDTRELFASSSLSHLAPHFQRHCQIRLASFEAGVVSQQCGALRYQQSCGVKGSQVHTKRPKVGAVFENAVAGKSKLTAFRLIGLMV